MPHRAKVPAWVPARILALTRVTPPVETGLSHWSSREMAAYLKRHESVTVSWHYVAQLWRDNDLAPHRQGTFKLSHVGATVNVIQVYSLAGAEDYIRFRGCPRWRERGSTRV